MIRIHGLTATLVVVVVSLPFLPLYPLVSACLTYSRASIVYILILLCPFIFHVLLAFLSHVVLPLWKASVLVPCTTVDVRLYVIYGLYAH